jgi:tetratricopeptide (TPR) repeat protein/O-antigen ligase
LDTQPPYALAERLLRAGLIAFILLVVPAVYLATDGPATDIKWLLVAWAAGILAIGWLVAVWRYGMPLKVPVLFAPLILGLLTVLCIALVPSEFRLLGIQVISRYVLLAALYFICSQVVYTEAHIRLVMGWTCAAMMFAAGYAFLQAAGLDPLPWDRKTDIYQNLPSTFGHPNFAAHALMFVIVYAAYLAATGSRWGVVFGAAFLVYLSATGQRAGWIALAGAVVLAVVAWLLSRSTRRAEVSAAMTVGATGILGVTGLGAYMTMNYLRSGNLFPLDHSLLLRYQSYVGAGDMFFERPLLGHGPGVYGIKNPLYWTPFEQEWFAQERLMNMQVHNDLIEFGIDGGMLAAGCYLGLLVTGVFAALLLAFRSKGRIKGLGIAFAAVFAAFAIDGLFGFNLRVPVSAAFFFIAMGMLEGLWRTERGAPEPAPRRADAFRWLFAGLVLVCAFFESRVFSSEYDLQQGINLKSTQPEQARELIESAYRKAPWNWRTQRQLGHLALDQGELSEALHHFERVFEINPYNLLTRLPLAQTRMLRAQQQLSINAGSPDEALAELARGTAALETLLEMCPMDPRAHELIGRIEMASGVLAARQPGATSAEKALRYWRKAEHHLAQAVQYEVDGPDENYRMLAEVRISLGDIMGAEKALSESVRRDPHNLSAWPPFLLFAAAQNRFDQARNAMLAQISLLKEESPVDTNALATAYLIMANMQENGYQNVAETQAAFEGAAALRPERLEIWTNYARFAREKGQLAALEAALLQADAAAASNEDIKLPEAVLAVNLYLKEGAPSLLRASEVMLSVVRSSGERPHGLSPTEAHGWAVALLEDKSREGNPDELCRVWFNLALSRNALADYTAAREWLERADTCLPADLRGVLAVHWADTLVGLGEATAAMQRLEQAIGAEPANLELRWAYARTLARIGLSDRARVEYEKLLAEPDIESIGRDMLLSELEQLQ